jgi:hypothetical protein
LSDIATATSGVAFETERLYICSTLEPGGSGIPTTSYVYNILNGKWTAWDEVFSQAAIGPGDELHTITISNDINRQRKKQTKLDFAGQNYGVTVTAVDTSAQTVTLTSLDVAPEVGWVIVVNAVISRIVAVVDNGSDSYTVTTETESTISVTDPGWGLTAWGLFEWGNPTPILYAGFETVIKLAPYHAGLVGRFKQFAQLQVHQRGAALSGIQASFAGPYSETSTEVNWVSPVIGSDSGWGLGFWGEFGWGNAEGISILTGTQPGGILRTYVPIRQQRSTFIQPILEHTRAAEEMNIQAISFSVRAFRERVSV